MGIHSDWGDWLPRAVQEADPNGLAVWYLGCNGFVLKAADGTTLLIDPYLGTGDPPRTVRMVPVPFEPEAIQAADAILATHEHTDHVHGPSQAPILAQTGAEFVGPPPSVKKARSTEEWTADYAVTDDQFVEVAEGDSLEFGGVTVHVEAAHDPDATHPVSYVIEFDGHTFFHGGDTKPADAFTDIADRYDLDLGALAFGSEGMIPDKETGEPALKKWYNDENQIIEAAAALELDRLLPTHWDMWKGLTADPTALFDHARSRDHPDSLEMVEIGDRIGV